MPGLSDPTDLDECLQRMPEIAQEVFEAAPAEYGFRPTPLWEMQQAELTGILEPDHHGPGRNLSGLHPAPL